MSPYIQILALCFLCSAIIIAYGTIRCRLPEFHDPLTDSVFPPPWDRFFDGWGLSHFAFFGVLAYIWPAQWPFIWLLGVLWELIELRFKDRPFYLAKCAYNLDTDVAHSKPGWWYGRWEDIIMNSAGIFVGLVTKKLST